MNLTTKDNAALSEIYKVGVDIWSHLQACRKSTVVSTAETHFNRTVAEKVDLLNQGIEEISNLWALTSRNSTDIDKENYHRELNNHKIAIENLENIAKSALKDHFIDGYFIGIGFSENHDILIIPPSVWAIGAIDYRNSKIQIGEMFIMSIRAISSKRLQAEVSCNIPELLSSSAEKWREIQNARKEIKGSDTQTVVIKGNIMGDIYNIQQAGAVGPNASSSNSTFQIVNQSNSDELDLVKLSAELGILRGAMRGEATSAEHDCSVGLVANAEIAAKNGDKTLALDNLKKAGMWALSVAERIGIAIAAKAIQNALKM